MNRLNVFVSSTCYDLKQIRADIHDFIEDLGHNPILSDFDNFPINPDKNTIDNCINAVKKNADILILIVGNRYGYEIETGKSITNTEFLTAQKKGIPIYVFIDKKTLNILPVWSKNKQGDFSDFVDTIKIFEFINEIRTNSMLWTFEFEKAQDIVATLKVQLSYLFKDAMEIRGKFNKELEVFSNTNLSSLALNLLLEKSDIYELEFFGQTLIDEIQKKEVLRNDLEYRIFLESPKAIYDNSELIDWLRQRFGMLESYMHALTNLIRIAFPKYYAEPGTKSDLMGIYYVSKRYASIYESFINWTIETSSTFVNDDCAPLKEKLANLSGDILKQIWDFPFENQNSIIEAKSKLGLSEEPIKINLELTLSFNEKALEEYNEAFKDFENLIFDEAVS